MQINDVRDLATLQQAMADIRDAYKGDIEAAHGAEDDLLRHVLSLVAERHPQAADLAAEAVKTAEWDVERWYA